jgi:acyl-homoserine lactone acylase PvdQ
VNDCDPDHFHGYVLDFDLARVPPRAFTYKTAYWKNESSTVEGFFGFGLAKNFDEFQTSVHKVVSLHNFFFADQKGNIAYWSAGARPRSPTASTTACPPTARAARSGERSARTAISPSPSRCSP